MPEELRELLAIAQECRDIADQTRFAEMRERLLEVADQLDVAAAERQRSLDRKATRH